MMSKSESTSWIWIISSCIIAIRATISNQPLNVAVNIGESATLNCSGDRDINNWIFQAVNSTGQVILTMGCNLRTATFECDYAAVTGSTSMDCQLVIRNASSACAGYYTCTDVNLSTRIAMVIVIDSPSPNCSTNAGNETQIKESTNVMMSCDITYSSPQILRPVLNWTHWSDTIYPTASYAYSSVNVENPIPWIPSDKCSLSFNSITNAPPETAVNGPAYTSSCTVADVFPLYCPKRPTITEPTGLTSENVTSGTILTCTAAESNPPAIYYEWWLIVVDGNETRRVFKSDVSTIAVYVEGIYVCNATNGLPGCTNTTAAYVVKYVIPAQTSLSTNLVTTAAASGTSPFRDSNTTEHNVLTTTSPDKQSNTVAIVLGIVIPLLIIGIIVAVVVVIWMRHRNSESTKPTQPLINGSEQQNNQFGTSASPEYARVNKPAGSSNQLQDIHVKDGNQMIYGQLNIADTRRRKPIQRLIEDRPFPYATVVRA